MELSSILGLPLGLMTGAQFLTLMAEAFLSFKDGAGGRKSDRSLRQQQVCLWHSWYHVAAIVGASLMNVKVLGSI